jgi:pimeloyl-ACP methyl ester carboxylesterase
MKVLLVHGIGSSLTKKTIDCYQQELGLKEGELIAHNWAELLDSSWMDGKKRRSFLKKIWKLDLWGDRVDDVASYFLDKKTREACIAHLKMTLRDLHVGKEDIHIIAHSLGSVLTLTTLSELPATFRDNSNLILCGSPMAMRGVRFKLWIDGFRFPKDLVSCTIMAGRRDPVCLFGKSWQKSYSQINFPRCSHDLGDYIKRIKERNLLR